MPITSASTVLTLSLGATPSRAKGEWGTSPRVTGTKPPLGFKPQRRGFEPPHEWGFEPPHEWGFEPAHEWGSSPGGPSRPLTVRRPYPAGAGLKGLPSKGFEEPGPGASGFWQGASLEVHFQNPHPDIGPSLATCQALHLAKAV